MEIDFAKIVERLVSLRLEALGDEATVLDAAQSVLSETTQRYRNEWEATANPIWVWRCITRTHSFAHYAEARFPDLVGHDLAQPPPWCMSYLFETAYRLEALAAGRDFRSSDAFDARFQVGRDGEVAPTTAAEMVPAALGLVRDGWNAFERFQSEDFPRFYIDMRSLDKKLGAQPSFTLDALMRVMGWTDERNARRKLSELRQRAKLRE